MQNSSRRQKKLPTPNPELSIVVSEPDDIHDVGDVNGNLTISPQLLAQASKLDLQAAKRQRVMDQCERTENFQVWAALDGNTLRQVDIENKMLGLYDQAGNASGGRSMIISFDGGNLNITNNTIEVKK